MQQEKIDAFDIIHCSFVLMHTERPEDILKKLRPFLAEDGKLIVIEADDMESSMVPDTKGLFQKFLELLLNDPYAGKRTRSTSASAVIRQWICRYKMRMLKSMFFGERERKERTDF